MKMRTGTFKTSPPHRIVLLLVGLLVLAGVFSDARLALAQTVPPWAEACGTPPAGVDINELAPSSTVQQVENNSASLMDFALAARDQFGQTLIPKYRYTLVVSSGRTGVFGIPIPPTLSR